ncbi:hypothetical protein V5O48_011837 [Marasmius crinis-equi]|uniref:Cytochrome P450 n=1 Tax=Marasmius crinis-equi TaxID=585013 RepID=A0ABR3F4I4_9AGAR
MPLSTQWTTALGGTALVLFYWLVRRNGRGRQFPGPHGLPLIGNALQIPPDRQWLKWNQWQKQYGDVMQISVFGQPAIILSSLKAANDLLESRGNIYSDRPVAVMAGELVGWNRGLGYTQGAHDLRFREFHRLFHQFIGPRACATKELQDVQEHENLRLLGKLLESPERFADHARESTSSTILLLSYGYPSHAGDPLHLVKIAEDAMLGFAQASEPGKWWVDSFPILKRIPSWFPGASFKRVAKAMRDELDKLYDIPYDYVQQEMRKGSPQPSFVSLYLDEKKVEPTAEEEDLVKAAAASLYSGGAETSPSAINSFFLAMALYPSVQAKAQAEIDNYLSRFKSTLPDFSDREALPYITAVMLEVWRWNPSVPLGRSYFWLPPSGRLQLSCFLLGLPHVVTQDDEYRGCFIQEGTVVWANIWSILHDETIFPDPLEFKPERYLDSKGNLNTGKGEASEAVGIAFGFGRRLVFPPVALMSWLTFGNLRLCPGLYLAENSVWLFIATALTVFDIRPDPNEPPRVEYDGYISRRIPSPYSMEGRNLYTSDKETLIPTVVSLMNIMPGFNKLEVLPDKFKSLADPLFDYYRKHCYPDIDEILEKLNQVRKGNTLLGLKRVFLLSNGSDWWLYRLAWKLKENR